MMHRGLAVLLLVAGASTAMAQISIPIPGTGGNIQVGPQQDQRDNRSYGASIRILDASYGRNCPVRIGGANAFDDLSRYCQGRDYCTYRIDARQLGDPSPGCAKEYHASYVCRDGGSEHRASARAEASGQSIVLDCRR
ncbi:MAG TPA: hypothetical protein VLA02_06120 [Reyranella sp.]|nr:hypothetical protein [Reyranella sp.]